MPRLLRKMSEKFAGRWRKEPSKKEGLRIPEGPAEEVLKESFKNLKSNHSPLHWKTKKKVFRVTEELQPNQRAWAKTFQQEFLVFYRREGEGYKSKVRNSGWLVFHNIQDLLARFFLEVSSTGPYAVANWRTMCVGITSMEINSEGRAELLHVPMFDYDGEHIERYVSKKAKNLQEKYQLGEATLYKTQNGIHLYFFSDREDSDTYMKMLEDSGCCSGFKKASKTNGFGVLRLSAKYTHFDIELLKVIPSNHVGVGRPGTKAAVVQALIALGQRCGTHLASMYPQWAPYLEDDRPWVPPEKRDKIKRVVKVSTKEDHKKMLLKQAYGGLEQATSSEYSQLSFTGFTRANGTSSTSNAVYYPYPWK
ncbi:MAG: hypothetical protein GF334_03670 [Candidatus Altiarchaeales archaeon]|nr:hypothetical protein [Candidatus Altiarchaeales archaeon]